MGIYMLYLGLGKARQFVPQRAEVWKERLPWIALVVAVLAIAPSAYVAAQDAWQNAGKKETRTLASIDAGKRAREGRIPIVLIAKELRIHANDLRKIDAPHRVVAMNDIQACKIPRQRSLVLAPERVKVFFAKNKNANKKKLASHQWLVRQLVKGKTLMKYRGSVARLDVLSPNPAILTAELDMANICS